MQTALAPNITAPPIIFATVSFLPLIAVAFAGISFFFLYKHWHNLEPIHTLWALFYGTEALHVFANEIAVILGHFTSFDLCPQNIIVVFTGTFFYLSVILLQADRWAAIYLNSKYKGLITNKSAVASGLVIFSLDLVVSTMVFLIDSSYLVCAHPPSLRLTRRTTIYIEGSIKMVAVALTASVSCYAVRTKIKKNKVAPKVQLGHLKREEDGAEERVKRARNTRDVFYIEQSAKPNEDVSEMVPDTPVTEEETDFLNLVEEVIESNKMPLMIIFVGCCQPVLGWMYAGCEEENECGQFLSKFKVVGCVQLLVMIVEIFVTVANITKF